MAPNNASPFYDGYCYRTNGFECEFKNYARGMEGVIPEWVIHVEDSDTIRYTDHKPTKTEAYAEAEKLTALMRSRRELLNESD